MLELLALHFFSAEGECSLRARRWLRGHVAMDIIQTVCWCQLLVLAAVHRNQLDLLAA